MMIAWRTVLMAGVLFHGYGVRRCRGCGTGQCDVRGDEKRLFDFPGAAIRAPVQGRRARTAQRRSVLLPHAQQCQLLSK